MPSFINRENIHSDIVDLLIQAKDGIQPTPKLTDDLKIKLAQLTLLYGLPVEYMVPDVRLLPTESIRFFYLDRNWLDRLVDGAMSVGVLSSQESAFNLAFFEEIYDQIDKAQLTLRSSLREAPIADNGQVGGTITGFIFRSQVVADFPGIEIKPTQGSTPLSILRMDTLSPNTLLCLFSGVPDKVEFIQPGEGLHFGLFPNTDEPDQEGDFHLYLRGLGAGGYAAGKQITKNDQGEKLVAYGAYRSGTKQPERVVNIKDLVSKIEQVMPAGSLKDNKLTAGGFAIQLTKTAQKQRYESGKGFPPCNPSNVTS